ncbi:acetoacetate--CoA ligase [Oceanobacillus neutriphilus]|uniref:Acetoacetyl-CoA synthetase n=1 Tax=Oceanobacillus neutriphilus TaxID=531815 RepID=A0ABQ2P0L2_9BACI|nr:acetoacetate--CoA ligase [Oceanobacillus neutriphilus]GGP15046.1 acetoacetyl-CoA synthetase [Oceanobacillus neutriphilus]
MDTQEGTLLFEPSKTQVEQANITSYRTWLQEYKQIQTKDYHTLWKWSVEDFDTFWESIWEYFKIQPHLPYDTVRSSSQIIGTNWFPEATINYTEHVFRNRSLTSPAIIHTSENRQLQEISWEKLYQDTAALQKTLEKQGIQKGDRVVCYAPNIYETVVAFLATASLGAIWSSASPDFGTQSVMERFQQIEPKAMITVDGYSYNGKNFNRLDVVKELQSALPSLKTTITIPYLNNQADFSGCVHPISWDDATANQGNLEVTYTPVGFNEPLWVLYSSGTTGKPKPIVHSQGGILLEHLKAVHLHMDLSAGSRFFWFTTTGWMMWNFLVGGLLTGSSIILYDGSPVYPDKQVLWRLAEQTKMNVFGTSASFITTCMNENLTPGKDFDLSHLRNISSTGSPLSPEGFRWCYTHIKDDIWLSSVSGGTDVCTAFLLGSPTLPVYAGEIQCAGLGAKIESFDEDGNSLTNEIGELVLTAPFPSMPIYFWNDDSGLRMYHSYFDTFPGIWCHGDYIKLTDRNTAVIYGRSDATINRGGIRIGTSEIYRATDHVTTVEDSLIVDLPKGNGDSITPLFIVIKDGEELNEDLKQEINRQLRTHCSPRHVPTHIYEVKDLPKTLNGKKVEIPIKKILMGQDAATVINKGSLINPDSLDYFIDLAKKI